MRQCILTKLWGYAKFPALVLAGFLALPGIGFAADRMLTLPSATVGMPYAYTFINDTSGEMPDVWQVTTSSVSGSVLPPGLSMTAAGMPKSLMLQGTPIQAGMYQFTVIPISASGTSLASSLVTLDIRPAAPTVPTITMGSGARMGTTGVAFSSQPIVMVEGGSGPYMWRLSRGGLPQGLRFTEQGAIEGVASEPGDFIFSAEVRDTNGFIASTSVRVSVNFPGANGSSTSTTTPTTSSPGSGNMTLPPTNTIPSSMTFSDRWILLNRLGIAPNTLVRTMELDPLVQRYVLYYIGIDGRRHPFQNDTVYQSWYMTALSDAKVISMSDLISIPLGNMITYRPGERVRFFTDPMTYVVAEGRSLRRLPMDDQNATSWTWQGGVSELSQIDRSAYYLMDEVATPSTYDPSATRSRYMTPNDILPNM